jgi:hypothetical protein
MFMTEIQTDKVWQNESTNPMAVFSRTDSEKYGCGFTVKKWNLTMKDAGISLHQTLGFWQEIQEEYVLCEMCWLASAFGPFFGTGKCPKGC